MHPEKKYESMLKTEGIYVEIFSFVFIVFFFETMFCFVDPAVL